MSRDHDHPLRARTTTAIVVLTLDDPNQSANTMNAAYRRVDGARRSTASRPRRTTITGVVITSRQEDLLRRRRPQRPQDGHARRTPPRSPRCVREVKASCAAWRRSASPVVAAINGAALGGGLEIALAAHHRVIVDDPKAVARLPRGPARPAARRRRRRAHGAHARHRRRADAAAAAGPAPAAGQGHGARPRRRGRRHRARSSSRPPRRGSRPTPRRVQPWDVKGYKIPGGTPSNPKLAQNLPAFPANLRKQLKGANYPAPHHIMAAAVEGAQVDFDTAIEIEGRYFVDLVDRPGREEHDPGVLLRPAAGQRRPRPARRASSRSTPKKVVVLGAGMMGAAIAYVCAKAGHRGRAQGRRPGGRRPRQGLLGEARRQGRRARQARRRRRATRCWRGSRRPTDPADAAGADLVIEAVFEDPKVKAQVFAEIEPHLAEGALLGSNTSTLPITAAGRGRLAPGRLHRAALLQPGGQDAAAGDHQGRADAATRRSTARSTSPSRSRKTPIVVNDSRGFFTSRVIGTFINEGIAMLAEGVPAPSIEQASSQAGYPAPVLQLSDELNLKLMRKIRNAAKAAVEAERQRLGRRTPPTRSSTACSTSSAAPGKLERRRLLRVRGRQARAACGRACARRFPPVADPSSISLQRPRGADALRRGAGDRQVPRRGRDRVRRRRQHRLDHRASASRAGPAACCSTSTATTAACRASSPARASSPSLRRALRAAGVAGREGRARRDLQRRAAPVGVA